MSHAQDRALERYGLHLSKEDVRSCVEKIRGGDAILLSADPSKGQRWLVMFNERVLHVVYRPEVDTLITVLPQDGVQAKRNYRRRHKPKCRAGKPRRERAEEWSM